MKILLELCHPANVHYFRNFIGTMKNRGHDFLIIARDKDVTLELLDFYEIPYINRGKGGNKFFSKLLDIPKSERIIFNQAKYFQPDIFMSFASMYVAHIAYLLRKPHIAFDDTEHNWLNHKLYLPFSDFVLTPYCFNKDLGKKQIRFNGFMEFGDLHPNYFKPDPSIFEFLNLTPKDRFVILRFISWTAIHDVGQRGLSLEIKRKAINRG